VVPVFVFTHSLMSLFNLSERFVVKKLDQAGSVVLLDDINNGRTQSMFSCLFDTVLNVGNKYQCAHAWLEPVMRVASTALVFNKVIRLCLFPDFSDVMIIGADSGQ